MYVAESAIARSANHRLAGLLSLLKSGARGLRLAVVSTPSLMSIQPTHRHSVFTLQLMADRLRCCITCLPFTKLEFQPRPRKSGNCGLGRDDGEVVLVRYSIQAPLDPFSHGHFGADHIISALDSNFKLDMATTSFHPIEPLIAPP